MIIYRTFYGGIGEIGGNKFLLEHDNTRVFHDFGRNFDRESQYFDFPLLQPYSIPDYLNVGALPEIKGLYRHIEAKPPVDAVLVTHPHVDHYAYIPLLDGRVVIYAGWGLKNIIEIRDETYWSYWDRKKEHINSKPSERVTDFQSTASRPDTDMFSDFVFRGILRMIFQLLSRPFNFSKNPSKRGANLCPSFHLQFPNSIFIK